jgi:hypothetical protein
LCTKSDKGEKFVLLASVFCESEEFSGKVKINAIWRILPQIRHAISNIAVTQMLPLIVKKTQQP